ncbi:MAG: hypothetical protein QNL24_10445 [Akkermansiaceae bacterium]
MAVIPATGALNSVALGFNGSSAVVTAPSPSFMNTAGVAFTVEFWMRSAAPVGG